LAVDFFAAVFRFAVDFFAAVFRLAVDFFRVVAAFLAAVFRFAVDFFRVVAAFLAAVFRFAVDFFRVVAAFFAAVFRFAVDLFAAVFRLAVDFLRVVAAFFAAVFRFAVDFLAAVFRFAVDFFAAVFFLAPDFLAVDFFFAVDFFRAPEERELLEERDDDRVVAGTATVRSASALSVTSPIATSPHASSASAAGSFHEPALDVLDASPVPLQSSWVMYDLLSRIARARSLPRGFLTCNADSIGSPARCKKGKHACVANGAHFELRQTRTASNGFDVGASTPPERSIVTITCSPRLTRRGNVNAPPANCPARFTDGFAIHASYVLPLGSFGSRSASTA
jgi:hypothetical protein